MAVKMDTGDLIRRATEIVGPQGMITDPADMAPYLHDERGSYVGTALFIARPASTAEVSALVLLCAEAGVAIVPQGGNTSLCGAATPFETGDEVVISLTRMNRVRDINPLDYTITVDAGVILADVQKAAAEADRLFPLSLGGEGTARIGGNLSTNAGGTGVLRYGNARELTLGIEVVLPDGRVLDVLSALRKDNTGYDLKQIFIGAEGTLGIITGAVLKLFPRPRDIQTAFAAVTDGRAAVELLSRARSACDDRVCTFEFIPRPPLQMVLDHIPGTRDPMSKPYDSYVLVEMSAGDGGGALRETMESVLAAAMEDGLVLDAVIAESAGQAADFWKIRETIPEAQRHAGAGIKHDISVPVSRIAEFIDVASARVRELVPGIIVVCFGHVGDGNVHFNMCQPPDWDGADFLARADAINNAIYEIVRSMDGSISAEHGIGRLKRDALAEYGSDVALDVMRTIKKALDPANMMNPGKVL